MKVLFVSNDPTIFDQASASHARMREYADAIGELHILSRAPQSHDETEGTLHLHARAVSKIRGLRALANEARSLISAHGIEIVSAQDPFEYGLVAWNAAKRTGAKLHVQVHTDFLSKWFTRSGVRASPLVPMPHVNAVRRRIASKVLPHTQGIRVVSERIRDSLVARYGARIPAPTVIPIQVAAEPPAPVPLPPHVFPFAFITVSRLEPEKRIEDILAALARIKDAYPAAGLVIVGDGREKTRIMRMIEKFNMRERVVLADRWLPAEEAWGMMRSAQAYIQASAYEGYSRTLIEAALARVPIITTDVGIVGEVFKGYEDVLAAPPGDPAALAVHMTGLLEDNQARQSLIMHAEAAALAHLAKYGNRAQLIADDLRKLL